MFVGQTVPEAEEKAPANITHMRSGRGAPPAGAPPSPWVVAPRWMRAHASPPAHAALPPAPPAYSVFPLKAVQVRCTCNIMLTSPSLDELYKKENGTGATFHLCPNLGHSPSAASYYSSMLFAGKRGMHNSLRDRRLLGLGCTTSRSVSQ